MNKKEYILTFLKSIYAGACIALACLTYVLINNKLIGALFFSLGLILILFNGFNLFTGKLCSLKTTNFVEMTLVWFGNFVGVFLIIAMLQLTSKDTVTIIASDIYVNKTAQSFLEIIFSGILCEVMIYFAVKPFKSEKSDLFKLIAIIIGVFVFVYCGFDHCVANMFYFFFSSVSIMNLKVLIFSTIGNILGAFLIYSLEVLKDELA